MRIQSNPPNIFGSVVMGKNEEKNEGISALFLDEDDKKANNKPKFEVRHENGYIRKYIVKANGDKMLIMETKQTENQQGTSEESGDLVDMAQNMLMNQLELSANPQKHDRDISAWEKENKIFKYKTGI